MRNPIILLAALLWPAGAAWSQVTVDLHALDSLPIGSGVLAAPAPYLPGPKPAQHPTATAPPQTQLGQSQPGQTQLGQQARMTPSTAPPAQAPATGPPAAGPQTTVPQPASPTTAQSRTPPSTQIPPPPPALPTETPATAALTPIVPPAPTSELAPPPPPPVSKTATTEAKPTHGGLQLTFGVSDADLNQASVDAIKQFAGAEAAGTNTYNVLAYAAGSANDPSAARRLSLSRALAVRSALITDGVASSRIFVRALGSQTGGGPADRVDINRLGSNAAAKAP